MKILKRVLILVLVCLLPICALTGCDLLNNKPQTETCTITFVQEGQENIVKTVEKGLALTDIPTPAPVEGCEVAWNVTDFSNIQEDITVNAVVTPIVPTFTITFVQEGKDDVVRTAKKGTALTDIPNPAPVEGYDVSWSVTDFSNIQSDMTVTAVATAKTFIITYVISDIASENGVVLATTTQTVTYGEAYELIDLPTYTVAGVEYVLSTWLYDGVEFDDGTSWEILTDITLTMAHFEPVETPEWIS